MIDYSTVKELAKSIRRPVKQLLALSQCNDPFYAGVAGRVEAAEWFARLYQQFSTETLHLRRIHYRLITIGGFLKPDGREYQNTVVDWNYLCNAGLSARYLDLIPFDGLQDRRNAEPMFFAPAAVDEAHLVANCEVYDATARVRSPDMPTLPSIEVGGFYVRQNFNVEVWIEKSGENDWLVPLCEQRGVNLVVGTGEQSETMSRQLAERAAQHAIPTRIIYLSDFDPGGRSMPKAVARKVEFTIAKFGLDVDLQLIPLALTPEQVRAYNLPPAPMKPTERRQDKFMETFGVEGATELDALQALHPGELARILNAELDNFLDAGLADRVSEARWEQALPLKKAEKKVLAGHAERLAELEEKLEDLRSELSDWECEADDLWTEISEELDEALVDLSDVDIPRSEAPGETDSFVLFDSMRDYLTQMDIYNTWRDGEES